LEVCQNLWCLIEIQKEAERKLGRLNISLKLLKKGTWVLKQFAESLALQNAKGFHW